MLSTKDSLPIFTLSLLTNVLISPARMPAILDGEEAVSKWLDFGEVSTQEALKLIRPIENITFHPVSPIVNNSRNNTPECLTAVDLLVKKVGVCDSDSSFLSFLSSVSLSFSFRIGLFTIRATTKNSHFLFMARVSRAVIQSWL